DRRAITIVRFAEVEDDDNDKSYVRKQISDLASTSILEPDTSCRETITDLRTVTIVSVLGLLALLAVRLTFVLRRYRDRPASATLRDRPCLMEALRRGAAPEGACGRPVCRANFSRSEKERVRASRGPPEEAPLAGGRQPPDPTLPFPRAPSPLPPGLRPRPP